jgi:hypothetical protein
MNELIQTIDRLPKILKIILCLFGLDVVWAVYRIVKGVAKNDSLLILVGIIWVVGAFSIGWLFDLVTVILYDHPKLA